MRLRSETSPPLADALTALEGLSVGDALGERFLGDPDEGRRRIDARELPAGPWRWTDDTLMACSVVDVLARRGRLDSLALRARFVRHFDPERGYGPAVREFLWQARFDDMASAADLFGGAGSYGNGAAMRSAPLGAWLAHSGKDELIAAADASARARTPILRLGGARHSCSPLSEQAGSGSRRTRHSAGMPLVPTRQATIEQAIAHVVSRSPRPETVRQNAAS